MVFERKGFAGEMVSNCNVAFANISNTFARLALTKRQHRPKAGKKKKDPRIGFFSGFLLPKCGDASS